MWIFRSLLQNGYNIIQDDLVNHAQVGIVDVADNELIQTGFDNFMKFVDVRHR